MWWFLHILLGLSLLGILASYIIYPLVLRYIIAAKPTSSATKPREAAARENTGIAPEELPTVTVLFAAYNEASVLQEKLESVLRSDYPADKLNIWVGSDCSTDGTNEILYSFGLGPDSRLSYEVMQERSGKAGILNALAPRCEGDLLLLTDANVIFAEDTVRRLVQTLERQNAAACGGRMIYKPREEVGISQQERDYLDWENQIKVAESHLWQSVMGLEGGCYLIRKEDFPVLPRLFFMEDFYVTMRLLEKRKPVVLAPDALAQEEVSVSAREEYRRKVRISIGNWQNLGRFAPVLWKNFYPLGLSFLLHKILRWITPFLLIISALVLAVLSFKQAIYGLVLAAGVILCSWGILGVVFSRRRSRGWEAYLGHFIYMNLALLEGFYKYLKGVKSNAWQPTARKQKD